MNRENIRKGIGTVLLSFLIVVGFLKPVQQFANLPDEIQLFQSQETVVQDIPKHSTFEQGEESVFSIEKQQGKEAASALHVKGEKVGSDSMIVQSGNFPVPVKKVDVKVLPDLRVIPGGQSIGVKLNTLGVLVVGHHLIETNSGKTSPGETAGIKVGDVITTINGQQVKQMKDIAPFIKKAGDSGDELHLTVLREEKKLEKKIKPVKDKSEKSYRIGLYIRDSAAGVGTLTFHHPESKKYGALGHVISDMDTKKPIIVNNGQILKSSVTSIEKGNNGNPGEKLARFNSGKPLGTITRNSPFGIFGELNESVKNGVYDKPMPIALSNEVKEGPAKILTVLEGNEVKAYDVDIVSTVPQKFPATKGMVIKVKDPELLAKTGGIVQGMSGSPIIQDDKLVGAVTHVFVNDSTSGYGVHVEWMLQEAGIDIYEENKTGKRMAS